MHQVFVSREEELERLGSLLSLALRGEGQICFVTGEAGIGKTSLTAEFARRAEEQYPDLLIAIGDCNSQTGMGDPFLPFREVLGMLAGDIDDRVAQGMTTAENANRLRNFLSVSKRIIKEVGPDLVDVFVPGIAAVTKAGSMVVGNSAERDAGRDPGISSAMISPQDVVQDRDQSRIFEQLTKVLVTLALERPLIVILDDLHWIDDSSANLLFHIARRIEGSRILVVGTYRPEEIDIGRRGNRHPLGQIISEVKRHYGDVIIELGTDDETSAREFVDRLFAEESIEAGAEFKKRFFEQTRGHPLFAVELLNDMREQGALVRSAAGRWTITPDIDWTALPARAEGVIEQRISRLDEDMQDILRVASVEGQTFTAQIVARVRDVDERELLRVLTRQLDRVHRLVREESVERLGKSRISRFRFRHQLFQNFLYDELGTSERELLHEDIATAIEDLFSDQRKALAFKLAWHFDRAGLPVKAAQYYLLASRRAISLFAYREAADLARTGLRILEETEGETVELELEIGLALGDAELHAGNARESMRVLESVAESALMHRAAEFAARAAIGYTEPGWRFNLIDATALDLLRRALALLSDSDSVLRARLLANLARVVQDQEESQSPLDMIGDATAMARRLGNARALIDCARLRFSMDRAPERIQERVALADETRELTAEVGEARLMMELLAFTVYDRFALGDLEACSEFLGRMRDIAAEAADPFYIYHERTMRVALLLVRGAFEEAEELALSALQTGRELGVTQVDGVLGVQLFTVRREQGRLAEFADVIRTFLERHGGDSAWRPGLALACADVGRMEEAREQLEILAADSFAGIARDSLRQTCLCYLAEVCDALADRDRAETLYEMLLPYADLTLVVGNATACLGASATYLGRLASLLDRYDVAESHFRHALSMNQRMNAVPWLAHAQYEYARLLLRRAGTGDRDRAVGLLGDSERAAHDFGMHRLAAMIEQIRRQL